MSLTKAIRFRHLAKQLTHEELVGFLSDIIDSRIEFIMSSLFQHLSKPNQVKEVTEFNQSLSDIIQSRKEKPKTICMRNIHLDQFPRAIIGYTASFLRLRDYHRFSLCNRSIHLGCNSPNTLQTLKIHKIKDYSTINLSSFPSIKRLSIDPSVIQSRHNWGFDSPNFNQVNSLKLRANEKCDWVQPFLHQNVINCDHVARLTCSAFGSNVHRMTGDEFLSLLAKFPNLTHLKMDCVLLEEDVRAQDIANTCSKIVSLSLWDSLRKLRAHETTDLVKIFAGQLKYLSLMQSQRNDFNLDSVMFGGLEELCLIYPEYRLLNDILKSASNLKKIFVLFNSMIFTEATDEMDIPNAITNLMVRSTVLNYMHFTVGSKYLIYVLDGIERGLFKSKKQEKKELHIHVSVHDSKSSDLNVNDFTLNVARIVNSLETSAIKDFMFIWELERGHGKDALKEIFVNLRNSSRYTTVRRSDKKFIVTNANCKVNGYKDYVCGITDVKQAKSRR
eukprot:378803_1